MLPSPSPKHHTYHQVSLSDDEYMEDATDFGGVTLEFNSGGRSPARNNGVDEDQTKVGIGNPGFLSLDTNDENMPSIAITPMTPPSAGSLSPDGHHTVSLNTPSGSPHFQNRIFQSEAGMNSNTRWMNESPIPPPPDIDAKDYFAYRDSIVQHVTDEVQQLVDSNDGILKGTWFLTGWKAVAVLK